MKFFIKRWGRRSHINFDAFLDNVYLTEAAENRIWEVYDAYMAAKKLKSPPNSLGRCSGLFEVLSSDADEMAGKLWHILDDPNSWVNINGSPLLRRDRGPADAEETAGKLWHLLDDPNTSVNTDDGPRLRGGRGPKEAK